VVTGAGFINSKISSIPPMYQKSASYHTLMGSSEVLALNSGRSKGFDKESHLTVSPQPLSAWGDDTVNLKL
jgi:hypothetical protein